MRSIAGKTSKISLLFLILSTFFLFHSTVKASVSYTVKANITVKLVYYFHRTNLTVVTPTGKTMNTTRPPLGLSETTFHVNRGSSIYFYTPQLSPKTLKNGTWLLHLWASTLTSGNISKLTVTIYIVSSDGSTEKAVIGNVANVTIDYGYSERIIAIPGNASTITSGDRIRITLYVQNDADADS